MSVVEGFKNYVKQGVIEHPETGWNKVVLGFKAYELMTRFLPNKKIAEGWQKLETMMMHLVAGSVTDNSRYVWGNIFAPCEIMQIFDLATISVECLGSFLTGYHLEDYLIDSAVSAGITPTLCSYHKTFIGAVESGAVKYPDYAVSTSLSCDGNLCSFRYLQKTAGVPYTFLDIPYENDEDSVNYLADQLKDLARTLEKKFGRPYSEEKFRHILETENRTRKALVRFQQLESEYYYPCCIIDQLYFIMAAHLLMGSDEFLKQVEFMIQDIQTYPKLTGKKILFVHLMPFRQESLNHYFSCSPDYQLISTDMTVDFDEGRYLDTADPFRALAEKIIDNTFNGRHSRKEQRVLEAAARTHADAAIHFCQWGCKQSEGGSILLKQRLQSAGIPTLILDVDGIDGRNNQEGQSRTRLEAFLEMLDQSPEEKKEASLC